MVLFLLFFWVFWDFFFFFFLWSIGFDLYALLEAIESLGLYIVDGFWCFFI
jgi:hypothetical protein